MTTKRTIEAVDRDLADLKARGRALMHERSELRQEEVERSHKSIMAFLDKLLCAHTACTGFKNGAGRTAWICDACETAVRIEEPGATST